MSMLFAARRSVKPSPVRFTVVLFDATKPLQQAQFAGRPVPQPATPKPYNPADELTATERRIVDAARRDGYADALQMVGDEAFAETYAAAQAERAYEQVMLTRGVRKAAQQRGPSAEDSLWWAMECDARERWGALDRRAEISLAQDRLEVGACV